MIKSWLIQNIHYRTGTACFWIHAPNDNSWNSCLNNCSCTHLTWFKCDIHCTAFKSPVSQVFTGFFDGSNLGVSQSAFISGSSIIAPANNLALKFNNTSYRNFSKVCRLLSKLICFLHIFNLWFFWGKYSSPDMILFHSYK